MNLLHYNLRKYRIFNGHPFVPIFK